MKVAGIVVLTIALGAGGVAACLARGADSAPRPEAAPVVQLPATEILIAKSDIGLAVDHTSEEDALKRGESVKVVRYGVQSTTTTQK
jgi:pilus assembly protein CpaB